MGKESTYPTIDDARAAGLWHPNCGHSISLYISGVTPPKTPRPDPEGYELRMQQRANERQIRKWKKRESVAITPEAKAKANAKVNEWQKKQRDFISKNDRKRDYGREKI